MTFLQRFKALNREQRKFTLFSLTLITGALILAPLAAVYAVFSPKELTPYLLFYSQPYDNYKNIDRAPFGVKGELIKIPTANGNYICAFYYKKANAPYTVLINHGQGALSSQIGLAKAVLMSQASALIFDYTGYGGSTGKPTTAQVQQDGIIAFDYLTQKQKIPGEKIILLGSSLGSGVASNTAVKRRCAGVVLIAPYVYLSKAARELLTFLRYYPPSMYPKPDLTCMDLMKDKGHPPITILHGAKDERINVSHSRELKAACLGNCRYVEYPESHHGDISMNKISDEINRMIRELEACHSAARTPNSERNQTRRI